MQTCRGVSEKTCECLRLKEAAKPLWGLFLVAIAQRFDDVTSAQLLEKTGLLAL